MGVIELLSVPVKIIALDGSTFEIENEVKDTLEASNKFLYNPFRFNTFLET